MTIFLRTGAYGVVHQTTGMYAAGKFLQLIVLMDLLRNPLKERCGAQALLLRGALVQFYDKPYRLLRQAVLAVGQNLPLFLDCEREAQGTGAEHEAVLPLILIGAQREQ